MHSLCEYKVHMKQITYILNDQLTQNIDQNAYNTDSTTCPEKIQLEKNVDEN